MFCEHNFLENMPHKEILDYTTACDGAVIGCDGSIGCYAMMDLLCAGQGDAADAGGTLGLECDKDDFLPGGRSSSSAARPAGQGSPTRRPGRSTVG
ncbi:hypothetical protein SORBI_3009G223700 [Sorghum bicolor]|jgi:hypothetical protein|uniref:Uncharacterized protein n=1 Tax=Sorghum bicolor TaxID=4558 RepID=A0A1B6P9Z1_SORBI|nr:hypothetical protein SORBI_3009G223700 [Sorghum bicolor]